MSWFMVDVEANGRYPGRYSMLELGAVVVEPGLDKRFHAKMRPRTQAFMPECMDMLAYNHAQSLRFPPARREIRRFREWVERVSRGKPRFISDNSGFDWQWVNDALWRYTGGNPFGFTGRDLSGVYKGLVRDMAQKFDHLRRTTHMHDALDDAVGNAEAMLAMIERFGLKVDLYGEGDHGEKGVDR